MLIARHAVIAFGAILVAMLISYFLAKEITKISNTVVQNRHLATTLEKRTEVFSTLARDTQIIGNNDTIVDNAFISSDNILEFISALESLAFKNGVTQSFHFENPTPAPISAPFALSTIGYSNNISTNISGLTNYLNDFEKLPYFTNIGSLTITSGDPLGWRGVSNISFRAKLYTKTI